MLLEDGIRHHPKILRVGAEAAWLWAAAIDYCREQLTDGFLPAAALTTLGRFRGKLSTLVSVLVTEGLFEATSDGWRVHDFLEHNHSKAQVLKHRDEARQRKRASRSRQSDSAVTPTSESSHGTVTQGHQRDVCVTLPRAGGTDTGTGTGVVTSEGKEPEKGAWQRTPLTGVGNPHRAHAVCGRFCVPAFLHDELRRKLPGDPDANDGVLRQWYGQVEAAWATRAAGDDDVKFWRLRFSEWQGTTKPKPPTVAEQIAEGKAKFLARTAMR